MYEWKCRCGQSNFTETKERPSSLRFDDGHTCAFVLVEQETTISEVDQQKLKEVNTKIKNHEESVIQIQTHIHELKKQRDDLEGHPKLKITDSILDCDYIIEIYDPELICECHQQKGSYYIEDENCKVGICRSELEKQYKQIEVIF